MFYKNIILSYINIKLSHNKNVIFIHTILPVLVTVLVLNYTFSYFEFV